MRNKAFQRHIRSALAISVIALVFSTLAPLPLHAQETKSKPGTKQIDLDDQIVPELNIDIPTIQFTKIKVDPDTKLQPDESRVIDIPWIAEYLAGIYAYAIMIASALAAVMMMIGGFQYLTAGGAADRVAAAKKRISDALVGLALTLGTYTLLNVINPELLKLSALQIKTVKRIDFSLPLDFPELDELVSTSEEITNMATTSSEFFNKPITFNSENIAKLEKAGKELAEQTKEKGWGDITIKGAGARDLKVQADIFKDRCIAGTYSGSGSSAKNTTGKGGIGRKGCTIPTCNPFKKADFVIDPDSAHAGRWLKEGATPYPQFCPHTSGFAVDISCSTSRNSIHGIHVPCHLILEKVMKDNGFCRLSSEPWHFELPVLSKGACPASWSPGTHKEHGKTYNYGSCDGWYDSYSEKDASARCTKK